MWLREGQVLCVGEEPRKEREGAGLSAASSATEREIRRESWKRGFPLGIECLGEGIEKEEERRKWYYSHPPPDICRWSGSGEEK